MNKVSVASSLIKVYGLGGLRCGWVFAPDSLVAALRRLVGQLKEEDVYLGEQISAAAFYRLDKGGENRPLLKKNLELVRVFIRGEPKLSWVEPDSGIIAFPRIEAPVDGTRLAEILEESYDTTVVPGRSSKNIACGWASEGRRPDWPRAWKTSVGPWLDFRIFPGRERLNWIRTRYWISSLTRPTSKCASLRYLAWARLSDGAV